MSETILELQNIRKKFQETEVLRGISLKADAGEFITLLGSSGCGKTTTLRIISGLETADSGSMTFDGEKFDLHSTGKRDIARLRRKTAFVFQNYNLFLNKTVLQNVTLGLTSGMGMDKKKAEAVALEMLEKVGMADKLQNYPNQLSGGQQQRVAIARAMATSPEIIYFDEPTSALDPELICEVLSVMRRLAEDGMTMLVVTHEMDFARNVSSKVMFMEGGKVVEAAPSKQFFEQPAEPRAREFIRTILENRK